MHLFRFDRRNNKPECVGDAPAQPIEPYPECHITGSTTYRVDKIVDGWRLVRVFFESTPDGRKRRTMIVGVYATEQEAEREAHEQTAKYRPQGGQ